MSVGVASVKNTACALCRRRRWPKPSFLCLPSSAASGAGGASTNHLLLRRGKHSKRKGQSSQKWLERQQKDVYVKRAQELGLPSRGYFKLQEINEIHYPALQAKRTKKEKGGQRKINTPHNEKLRRLIQPGMSVLDLGAAPGGWSLYASTQLQQNHGGTLVAVDLLPLDGTLPSQNSDIALRIASNLPSFEFIRGDFTKQRTRAEILDAFAHVADALRNKERCNSEEDDETAENNHQPTLIISDMAANFMVDSQSDALRTLDLCERALAFAVGVGCLDPSHCEKNTLGALATDGAFLCKYFSCGKENEADLMEAARRAFRSVHTIKPKASRKESSEMYLLALGFNA